MESFPRKAMIFAAGRGKRMAPLTDATPKPLLKVRGRSLIEHHLYRLRAAGVAEVLINIAYLGEQIERQLGDGSAHGLTIHYSREPYPLETGGAVLQALPLLGDSPFLAVNADIWTDYPFTELLHKELAADQRGHLVLTTNPLHNPEGDFGLDSRGCITDRPPRYTYTGVGLLHPRLVADYPQKREAFPLVEAFHHAREQGRLSGEVYRGEWDDVGTPERLAALQT